jgi:hypothetical protein
MIKSGQNDPMNMTMRSEKEIQANLKRIGRENMLGGSGWFTRIHAMGIVIKTGGVA